MGCLRLPGDGLAFVIQEGSTLLLGQGSHYFKHSLHTLWWVKHPLVVDTREN